jgi:hypothetical protein
MAGVNTGQGGEPVPVESQNSRDAKIAGLTPEVVAGILPVAQQALSNPGSTPYVAPPQAQVAPGGPVLQSNFSQQLQPVQVGRPQLDANALSQLIAPALPPGGV